MSLSTVFLVVAFSVLTNPYFTSPAVIHGGFSVELIHRDSPKSPYYDPTECPFRRFHKALRRSHARASRLTSISYNPTVEPAPRFFPAADGEYLLNILIGTPPVPMIGIMDTGSDMIWTQCSPCINCFRQGTTPLFDPTKSSTYHNISCNSKECKLVPSADCDHLQGDICRYSRTYVDRSFSKGHVATETFSFDSSSGRLISFPRILFGCGHENGETHEDTRTGVIGFGGTTVSLASQLYRPIGGRFSYCLVPSTETGNSSRLNFGNEAVVSGPGTVSTPFVHNTFAYYITLQGISVSGSRIEFRNTTTPSTSTGEKMIIDSGATLSFLRLDYYWELQSAVSAKIKLEKVRDPRRYVYLCYRTTTDINAPAVTFHFQGADVQLGPSNTFSRVSNDTLCFNFVPAVGVPSIYGNTAQTNFLVGYDMQNKVILFKPTDWTKV